MRRIVLALVVLGASGGPQIPVHSGYKTDKVKPWKKPKAIALDPEKQEGKAEGDLNYAEYKRAKWFSIDVPANGELDLRLEITPPGEEANEDFDLAMEVLDPGYRVISKSDLEDEDAHELNKVKTLYDLAPGKYLVHLYLQGRRDTADFVLRAAFKRTAAAEVKSDFPAKVAFTPPLPMVPLNDDTPKSYKPPTTTVVQIKKLPVKKAPVEKAPPPVTTMTARIINMQVIGSSTQITIGRGTSAGAAVGMKGKIVGVPTGSFSIAACNERTCTATVSATPDQIKGSGSVVLTP